MSDNDSTKCRCNSNCETDRTCAPTLKGLIVGAGPAGFFTYEELQRFANKKGAKLSVDMINRDIRPGGLVVYGVAPDHTKIRSLKDQFEQMLSANNINYFGNVRFGEDITLADLNNRYHFIIYAVGAQSDQHLGIPGENLQGCFSGRTFIAWYNGDPAFSHLSPKFDSKRVILVGAGNVAADIARVLVRPHEELAATDIASYALQAIMNGATEEVVVCVRRAPAHVKFTPAELRALGELRGVDVVVEREDLALSPELESLLNSDREAKKNYEILCSFLDCPLTPGNKRIRFKFFTSPASINGEGNVKSVTLIKNKLVEGKLRPISGSEETIETSLIVNSVGYKVVPIPGVPYDEMKNVIRNNGGRVNGEELPRQYVVGWAADGATGIIGTNKVRARKVVSAFAEDFENSAFSTHSLADIVSLKPFELRELLKQKNLAFIDFPTWKKIDEEEIRQGELIGRPRLRFQSNMKMLEYLSSNRDTVCTEKTK